MAKSEKADDHLSPFKRFEKLAKGLLAVPRKELQEKLDKYQREKQLKKSRSR
jgi:hypothetical protein